jgi:pimeloyl-ACP methyl ester carboxylesterase
MQKTVVYFMPGLAASPKIFEYIKLDTALFEMYYLEWLEPLSTSETLHNYVARLAKQVKHPDVVLIGVSFGGIIVQELSKYVDTKKVIIISSVKSPDELPLRLKIIKNTKLYKIAPTSLLSNFDFLEKFVFGTWAKKRFELYKKYLSMNSPTYLNWAFHNVLHWHKCDIKIKPIHIHGVKDEIFPIDNINTCDYTIENGTHIMIINRAKWFNIHLGAIIDS